MKKNGSVTIEAVLTFPLFLSFFIIILYIIRMAAIQVVLNHAAGETAKQLAALSYPVALINEMEDEHLGESARDYNQLIRDELDVDRKSVV